MYETRTNSYRVSSHFCNSTSSCFSCRVSSNRRYFNWRGKTQGDKKLIIPAKKDKKYKLIKCLKFYQAHLFDQDHEYDHNHQCVHR